MTDHQDHTTTGNNNTGGGGRGMAEVLDAVTRSVTLCSGPLGSMPCDAICGGCIAAIVHAAAPLLLSAVIAEVMRVNPPRDAFPRLFFAHSEYRDALARLLAAPDGLEAGDGA